LVDRVIRVGWQND